MTSEHYQVVSNPSVEDLQYLESLEKAPNGQLPYPHDNQEQQRIRVLRNAGYLKIARRSLLDLGEDSVQITVKGRDTVAEWRRSLRQQADEATQREKEKCESQKRADELAHKDARRSWWQWFLRILFDLLIFLLGVYLGGATKTFQWFIAIFH